MRCKLFVGGSGYSILKNKRLRKERLNQKSNKNTYNGIVNYKIIQLVNRRNDTTKHKQKRVHSEFFSIFAAKNFYKPKYKTNLLISFVMKKKIGNAVKRNKIKRKLKAIVHKLLKKRGAISRDYTYIVFGKPNAYTEKQSVLMVQMLESFKKLIK